MESLFEPSVMAIIEAVRKQCDSLTGEAPVSRLHCPREALVLTVRQTAFLVGGFAASPWLFARLEAALKTQNIQVCRPDHHTYVCLLDM